MTFMIIYTVVAAVLALTVLVLHGADKIHINDVPVLILQSVFWPVTLVAFLAVEFGVWLKAKGCMK